MIKRQIFKMVVGFLVSCGCFLANVDVDKTSEHRTEKKIGIYVNLKGKRLKERMDKDRILYFEY